MAETTEKAGKKNTGMAIIAYLLFFVPLLTEDKDDPFVKFHVKQSILVLIASIAVSVIGGIIPIIGWFLIVPLGGIACFVLWVIGIINAANGEKKELPVIGKYAEQFLKF